MIQSKRTDFRELLKAGNLTVSFSRMAIAELTFADGSKATMYQAQSPSGRIVVLEPDEQIGATGLLQGREFIQRVNHEPTDWDMTIVHGAMLEAWEHTQERC